MSDAISKAIEALNECISVIEREQYDYEYRGTCAAANDAIEALQALQSGESSRAMLDAVTHGTGITKGGKHVPLEDFYVQHIGEPVALERVEAHLEIVHDEVSVVIEPDPNGSLVYYDNVVRAKHTTPQPVVDVNKQLVEALTAVVDAYECDEDLNMVMDQVKLALLCNMLGLREREAQPVVPDEKPLPELMMASYHESKGWNDCRNEMLRLLSAGKGGE